MPDFKLSDTAKSWIIPILITAFLAFIGLIVGHTALPPIAFIQLFLACRLH